LNSSIGYFHISTKFLCSEQHLTLSVLRGFPETRLVAMQFNFLASGWFRGFSEKKRLNPRGFAREFLRSRMLYRPGKSLKRRVKSSSLHSKKYFLLGGCRFFVM